MSVETFSSRDQADKDLAVSELRYRRLFESAKDGILILNAETGMVVDVNPFLVELLGFTREAFLGKKIWELGFIKDIVANQANFAELQRQEYIRYEDKPLSTADGRRIDVEFVSNVYLVNRHKVIQCNIRDITERKRADEKIRASEAEFRAMFEMASIGMAQADPRTGLWLRVNQKMCEITGYTADELLHKHIAELTHPDDRQRDSELFQRVVRGEAPDYHIEKRYLRKDGTLAWVNVNMAVIRDALGRPTRTMATIEDIGDRRKTEESITRLATAVEQVAETIVITDIEGTILYANPAFEKTTGYTREEALGKNPRILKSDKQDAAFYRRMWAVLGRGEVWNGHFINKRKDGTLYEEDASISPVRDVAGKIVNYVAAKRDVTHEVLLESQLRQAQKMEAVGRLAGGVAHDFNNLLMGIMGYVELCRDQTEPAHPIREWLDEITHIAQRSAQITQQLLAFARKQTVEPKILDINDAVNGMLKLLRRLLGEDIDLAWQPGADLRLVKVDPSQVDQILANLCLNARDAIEGAGKITMETGNVMVDAGFCAAHTEAAAGEYVFLAVSDDGCGMEPETLAQIFEPFFTTKAMGNGKGTGLGLATVYGIVKQNNGFICADSTPGKGTTFTIYLPQVAKETSEMAVSRQAEMPKGHGENILLVEDENALRRICRLNLISFGYHVLEAETPGEALALVSRTSNEIHLLLTDVVMPGMDGRQLAQRISAAKPDIKVLFMSGYTADVIAERGVLEQNTAFLSKPFTRDDLARKVSDVLKK